jgi:hypothetical protein
MRLEVTLRKTRLVLLRFSHTYNAIDQSIILSFIFLDLGIYISANKLGYFVYRKYMPTSWKVVLFNV